MWRQKSLLLDGIACNGRLPFAAPLAENSIRRKLLSTINTLHVYSALPKLKKSVF